MRKMKKLTGFISLLIFIPSINSFAIEKVAQTGCKFLDVAAGARACGMGEAYTVLGQDANALFYNPSCIGEIDKNFDLAVGRTEWIAEIDYFGFSVIAPDYGEIEGTRISTENEQGYIMTGLLDVNAFCAGVGYAREFTEKFTVGAQVKYVAQQLGWNVVDEDTVDNEISTLSYDFGLLFYPGFKSFAFGMSVRNFSPRVTYEQIGFEMPLTFTLGVGVDIMDFLVENPNYSFKIGAEMLHPRDWQEQFHLGGEFGYMDMIFLRAGYKFRYSQEGLNLGVGLNIAGAKIDYSYSEFELFDIINRISVGFAF
jgi:hypothetical protein